MWFAQVGLWIQRDVVDAIRSVNETAAQRLKPDEDHVANAPVKRIMNIRVTGYVNAAGALIPFEELGTSPGQTGQREVVSFTGRKSDAQFDVLRFTVQVVADQRDLLKLANAICTENLYQLVDLDYRAVTDADREGGYYYGSEPVVVATLRFEGYMARNVYGEKMPPQVAQLLSQTQPG
jgi:hypothetical protein